MVRAYRIEENARESYKDLILDDHTQCGCECGEELGGKLAVRKEMRANFKSRGNIKRETPTWINISMPIWISEAECAGLFNRVTCACECPLRQALISSSPKSKFQTITWIPGQRGTVHCSKSTHSMTRPVFPNPFLSQILKREIPILNTGLSKSVYTTNPNWVAVDGSVTKPK